MMGTLRTEPARPQARVPQEPFHTWELGDGTPWTEFYRAGGGYLLRFPELADFAVSATAREITCFPVPGVSEGTPQHLYLNQVLPLALSKQGKLVFHAAAVEVDGGAVVFAGESGRGKSTLAASFAVEGQRFMTDDGLVLEATERGHMALPSHPSIRLWADSEAALVWPGTAAAEPVGHTSKARFLAGERLPYCNEPRPLRRVYFLGDGGVNDIGIRPLCGAEAMVEWVKHSFLLDVEERPRLASHFEQVARLAREPIHYRLDYPRRFEDLPSVRHTILDHVRRIHG